MLTVIPCAHPAWPVGAVIPEPWQKELLAGATRFADEIASKLIIMGYQHRGLSRVMMGSVSHTVLHRSGLSRRNHAIEVDKPA